MFFCYSPLQQLQQSPSGDLQTLPLSWTSSWSEVSCQTPPLTRSLNLPAENPPKKRNSLKPLKRIFKNFLFGSGHTELSGRQRTQHQPQISNHVSVSWICFYQEAENVLYRKSQTGFFLWGGPDPLTLWPSDWKPPPSSSLGTNLQFQSFRGCPGGGGPDPRLQEEKTERGKVLMISSFSLPDCCPLCWFRIRWKGGSELQPLQWMRWNMKTESHQWGSLKSHNTQNQKIFPDHFLWLQLHQRAFVSLDSSVFVLMRLRSKPFHYTLKIDAKLWFKLQIRFLKIMERKNPKTWNKNPNLLLFIWIEFKKCPNSCCSQVNSWSPNVVKSKLWGPKPD